MNAGTNIKSGLEAAFVFMILAGASADGQSPVEWTVSSGGNGHWYLVNHESLTWHQARDRAAALGGHLCTLTTPAEDAFVRTYLSAWPDSQGYFHCFLGGLQEPDSVTGILDWRWITGETWSWTGWAPGEPNDCCGGEDYLEIYFNNSGWNDLQPQGARRSLIEWSADCNGDGLVDFGQIRTGLLPDSDGNGIPDGCESLPPQSPPGAVACWGRSGTGWCPLPEPTTPVRWVLGGSGRSVVIDREGGITNDPAIPGMPISFSEIIDVASDNSILVLTGKGRLFAFGMDNYGQVSSIPEGLTGIRKVAAGAYANGVVFWNGTVACWGYGGTANVPAGLTGVRDLHLSHNAAFAVRNDGSVVGWGSDWRGELNIPADLGAVRAMDVGDWHAIALRMDGSVRCWGDNGQGQLNVPAFLGEVIEVQAAGGWLDSGRCMVLRRDGSVLSWGCNAHGEGNFPSGIALRYLHAAHRHSLGITGDPDCNGDGIYDHRQIRDGELADGDSNGVPDACECPGDVDGDATVDAEDLAAILFAWGTDGGKTPGADINGDGMVDANDLSVVLGSWGACPE